MSDLLPCPFCGSVPDWRQKQPAGRDGSFEIPLRSIGCVAIACAVKPHTAWENDNSWNDIAKKWERLDSSGASHIAAWNKRA